MRLVKPAHQRRELGEPRLDRGRVATRPGDESKAIADLLDQDRGVEPERGDVGGELVDSGEGPVRGRRPRSGGRRGGRGPRARQRDHVRAGEAPAQGPGWRDPRPRAVRGLQHARRAQHSMFVAMGS